MRLLPREEDRLQLFLAAELARRRRGRGLLLNQAEAIALIADEVCEAARDGRPYAEVEALGYTVLTEDDVLDGVSGLVPRVEVEALFDDGMRLIVLHEPLASGAPPAAREVPVAWDAESSVTLDIVNEGDVPVAITSHFHVFEVNRDLRLDRRAAWGCRLAIPAGQKLTIDPGETVTAHLRAFGGARVIRGHAGLCDGPLDAVGALERALGLARERGYRGA